MILPVETGGENGVPSCNYLEGIEESAFVVDYVRAYQYKSR